MNHFLQTPYVPHLLPAAASPNYSIWIVVVVVLIALALFVILRIVRKPAPASNSGAASDAAIARAILDSLGGASNIASVDHCITRLRLTIHDPQCIDEKQLKTVDCAGIIRPSKTDIQVVIGKKVAQIAEEFEKLLH